MKTKIAKFFKNYHYEWKFKLQVCLPIFLGLVAIDWISKIAVQATMEQGEIKSFIDGFMNFIYIINPGSAYGFNANNLALAVSLATVVTVFLIVAMVFINGKHWLIGLSVVLAGSFANLIARSWAPAVAAIPNIDSGLVGLKGGVIDFLHFEFKIFNSNTYIFNFADVFVITGVIMVVLGVLIEGIISLVKKHQQEKKVVIEKTSVKIESNETTVRFTFKDESKLTKTELKKYRKELKAYQKMQKMKEQQDEKNNR